MGDLPFTHYLCIRTTSVINIEYSGPIFSQNDVDNLINYILAHHWVDFAYIEMSTEIIVVVHN
jgi:hypothetical protein